MKEMMKQVFAFITFEQAIIKSQIELKYRNFCNALDHQTNASELISTRNEIIYKYWYNHVIKHFCFIMLVATIITHLAINKISFPAVAMAGLVSFSIMYLFYYRFILSFIVLPSIEMIREDYEQKLSKEIKKCRKAQYSNFSLVLIDYIRDEISAVSILPCDDNSASMLTKLYGVDTGSMKKNLELLFIKNKRKHFTERKKTEYKNRFNEAYEFFEKRGCLEGVKKLKEFELNFFNV